MLDQTAVGLSCRQHFSYTWRDIILYNLSVGAEAEDLAYVYEKDLKMIPTFCVIPCTATFGTEPYYERPVMPTAQIVGLRTDGSLHMDHMLQIFKPLPVNGTLDIEKVITGIYNRGPGKGTKITVDIHGRDEKGELYFTNTMGYLNRWAENCGGERPRSQGSELPERSPDFLVDGRFSSRAALLYRLTGDTYPIHVDPEIAGKSGLPGPIVHGLCSLGNACRLLTAQLFPGRPECMRALGVQFRAMALPGDRYTLQIWCLDAGRAGFRMVRKGTGTAILDNGWITWA